MGRLAIVGFAGHSVPADLRRLVADFDLGGVIYFARNIVEPAQVAELSREVGGAGARVAALDQRRSGGRPRRAAAGAVHRVAAGDDARPQRRRRRWPSGSPRRWRPSCAPSASTSTTRRCSTSTRTRRTPSSAIARCRDRAEDGRAPRRDRRPRRCRTAGVAACGKHFPGPRRHERRFARGPAGRRARPASARGRRARAVPSRPSRRGVATIMTAHVLVPALDERAAGLVVAGGRRRPAEGDARLRGRGGQRRPGHEGRQRDRSPLPEASVARDRGRAATRVLLCNSTVDEQVAALEAPDSRGRVRRLAARRASTMRWPAARGQGAMLPRAPAAPPCRSTSSAAPSTRWSPPRWRAWRERHARAAGC